MNIEPQHRAPVYEMLKQYRDQGNTSYHVPGHKYAKAYRDAGGAGFLNEVMQYDITEVTGTDDLHHPEGAIHEAQVLAAECFGAEESYFLVGGSTAGNLALILTVCYQPGMTLILQRNVHKSVIHGLMLAGAQAVFLEPQIDPASGLAVMPEAATVQAALAAYPQAAGVLVTLPNYYGMGSDLTPLAEVCHASGVPLLVDEAHGAHYGQHPALPAGALQCGADGVVQSTHKMLPALTMGAMLHVQGPRLNRATLRQRLAMVQSSSPSYPVMASLDLARRLLHSRGSAAFTAGLAAVKQVHRGLAELPRFKLLQPGGAQQASPAGGGQKDAAYSMQDPFKVVIYDGNGVLGGFELQRRLEEKGCVPEMSDNRHVVLVFSLGSTAEDAERLLKALSEIDKESRFEVNSHEPITMKTEGGLSSASLPHVSTWNNFGKYTISAPVSFSMKPMQDEDIETIPLGQSAGRVAAEMIIPYPPGIPLLYSGESIHGETQARLAELAAGGAKFQACSDPVLQYIKVYKNRKGGEA